VAWRFLQKLITINKIIMSCPLSAVDGNRWLVPHVCVGPSEVTQLTELSFSNRFNSLVHNNILAS